MEEGGHCFTVNLVFRLYDINHLCICVILACIKRIGALNPRRTLSAEGEGVTVFLDNMLHLPLGMSLKIHCIRMG